MRADAHYVEQLDSRHSRSIVQLLPIDLIEPRGASPADPPPNELVDSVRSHGILQPLLVQGREGRYGLISGHGRLAAAKAAGLRRVPCLVHDVDDEQAEVLGRDLRARSAPSSEALQPRGPLPDSSGELAAALSALTACVDLLESAATALPRRVLLDVLRAEVGRASALTRATRVLEDRVLLRRVRVSPRRVVDRVGDECHATRRLRAIDLEVKPSPREGIAVVGDEELLVLALSSLVNTWFGLLEGTDAAQVTISFAVEPPSSVVFAVSQAQVVMPDRWMRHFFDDEWTDRPKGMSATLLAAARRIASLHQGHAAARTTEQGVTLSMTLPLAG